MSSPALVKYSYKELEKFTNGFGEDRHIGSTQFGQLYQGRLPDSREVTIKLWEWPRIYAKFYLAKEKDYDRQRMRDEITFLHEHEIRSYSGVAKLVGFCDEDGHLGIVYDLKTVETLHNLIKKDDFGWLRRIKVAIQLARLLEYLHSRNPPYVVQNLDAHHIMLDEDYNLKLLDFSMVIGGVFDGRPDLPYSKHLPHGSFGYTDYYYPDDSFSDFVDIFAFGVILLGLISQRVYEVGQERLSGEPSVDYWALELYESRKNRIRRKTSQEYSDFSLVNNTLVTKLRFSRRDGYTLTKLGMECTNSLPDRPESAEEIVNILMRLRTVRRYGNELGI